MRGYDFIMIGFCLMGLLVGIMLGDMNWKGGVLAIAMAFVLYGLMRDDYQATRRKK